MLQRGRKIAAILAADVVDYSRLMGMDEPATLAALKIRRGIFEQLVREFEGRGFGSVGDSLMAQFPSAVNAVQCALAIQQSVAETNEPLPADRRMSLRIGINLGDVIEEDGNLFGDGVNVAARLQALAAPGGILVSESVHQQVWKKVSAQFASAGARHVKNVAEPLVVFEVLKQDERQGRLKRLARTARTRSVRWSIAGFMVIALATATVLTYRERSNAGSGSSGVATSNETERAPQSIAVLPFENLSGDVGNEHLGDGVSEELLHRLSNVPGLLVAARTSSAYFKESKETASTIGRMLGVEYLLEGSVRRSGDTLRITAQLVDAQNGYHVWSDSFDRPFKDVLAIQDEISLAVLKGLEVPLIDRARAAALKHTTTSPEALDLYLRARREDERWELEKNDRAIAFYEQAIAIDPEFAAAYAALAYSLKMKIQVAGLRFRDPALARVPDLVRKAVELDPTSGDARAQLGHLLFTQFDLEGAEREFRLAERLSPNSAATLQALWEYQGHAGWPPEKVVEYAERWLKIDPLNPFAHAGLAIAQFHVHRYEESLQTVERLIAREPEFWVGPFIRTGTLLEMGRFDEAVVSARREMELRDSQETRSDLVSALALAGHEDEARKHLADLLDPAQTLYYAPSMRVWTAVALNDVEAALSALERTREEGDWWVYGTLHNRILMPLHDEPRFQAIVRQFGQERRVAYMVEKTRDLPPWPF